MQPPISSVDVGISKVIELSKSNKLKIFKTCKGLLDEAGRYKRKMDKNGNVLDEIEDKRKYHRLDGLRYACCGITSGFWVMGAANG